MKPRAISFDTGELHELQLRRNKNSSIPRKRESIVCLSLGVAIIICGPAACRRQPDAGSGPYAAIVAQAIPAVERATGLRFKTPPKVQARSKAQVRAYVLQQLNSPAAKRDLAGESVAYKLLGMIPDTLDLGKLETDLLEEQIVGFYDPATKVLYVVSGSPKDMVQTVVTHELVHALQDQYVNLDSIQKMTGDNDRAMASDAVFEGQAVYDQVQAMLGPGNLAVNLPGGWERVRQMIRDNRNAMPVYSNAPLVIQESLLFPYLSGAEFVKNFKEHEPGKLLYNDMPMSTEQVLHPAAFFGHRDVPTPVSFGTIPGVSPTYENDLGEFETRLFLYQNLQSQDDAVRGADGWDGDRYIVFSTARGNAIAWATVWDSKADATDFYELGDKIRDSQQTPSRDIRVTTGSVNGRPVVLWLNLPSGLPAGSDAVLLSDVRIGAKR